MRRARFPARTSVISDTPNGRAAASCSSTKSPTCRLRFRSKLLRVLEDRSFHRVGGEASIPLNARIVCATSENLIEQIRHGRFREDLLYRINTVTVEVPPLRERPERHSLAAVALFFHDDPSRNRPDSS